jgi:tellurite methyltransferase
MNPSTLNKEFRGMDMSLLDQLLKGRFTEGSKVLDAGFGGGRNLYWFVNNGFDVYGIDQKEKAVDLVRNTIAQLGRDPSRFIVGQLENLPYENDDFNIVICNAVLHFSESPEHFLQQFGELVRVLKSGGILFIRMTSDIGIKDKLDAGNNGVYLLPDGGKRFLLTRELLADAMQQHQLKFVEQLKTVNVNDIRCMSTLVLSK